jgi:hypothetical protein
MDAAHQLDRAAARRVLRRASAAEPAVHDPAEQLDPETIVAAAVDAGIAETEVRHALAVERLGAPPPDQHGDRLVGAGTVAVDDEVPGSPGEVLLRLDAWLVGGHHLRRDRLRDGRAVWRRRSGMLGATYRTLRHATGEGHLGEVRRIDAAAIDTGSGTCVVRVTADRRRDRVVRAGVGGAVATLGTGVVVGLAALTAPLVLVAAPLALAAGAGLAATGRGAADDLSIELERVLDAVGQQAKPARLGTEVVRRTLGRGRADGAPPPPPAH